MNMAEALSREVQRVTELCERYRSIEKHQGLNVGPAIAMMDIALEGAHIAAGSNDALQVIQAYTYLKGFEK